jgi:hypothetical protein
MQANQAADQGYFAGQQSNAAAVQPQLNAYYASQLGQLQAQQAAKAAGYGNDLRAQGVNEQIARDTLAGNLSNQAADNALAAQQFVANESDKKAQRVVSRKNTRDRIAAANAKTKATQQAAAQKQAAKDQAAAQKKHQAIQSTTAKAEADVSDIQKAWARGATVAAPTATDPNATRPATRTELRNALGAKYGGTMVEIMERVRAGQPLTQQQVQYLRGKYGQDFRVPSHWRAQPRKPISRPGNAPSSTAGEARPT